jgi:hypothetical protein
MQKTVTVDPRSLVFSPWNVNSVSPENQKKLEESIRRNGVFRPIVVREVPGGKLQVIAGEHTTRAVITLGFPTIDAYNLGPISDLQAKEISIIDNQHFGVEDSFGLAEILRELDNPGEFLPFDDKELSELFKSSSIDLDSLGFEDEDDTDAAAEAEEAAKAAPVTHQIMRMKVALKDVELVTRTLEAVMRRQGFKSGDSLLDAGDALVHLISCL